MQVKHCLVTGASGFIGQVLCKNLQSRGVKVRALVRRAVTGVGDETVIFDLASLDQNNLPADLLTGIDTIFHLAGIAHTDIPASAAQRYYQINVRPTESLLKAMVGSQVRSFIYLSSTLAIHPTHPYGYSKQAAEKIVLQMGKQHDFFVAILRPALVYGSHLKGNLLSMLRGIEQGWFPPLPKVNNCRSLVSVADVANALILMAENANANRKVYTLTDGRTYSSRAIYDAMRSALGLPPISWSVPLWVLQTAAKAADIVQLIIGTQLPFNSLKLNKLLGSDNYSATLIQQELGWAPRQDFFSLLPEIVRTYQIGL